MKQAARSAVRTVLSWVRRPEGAAAGGSLWDEAATEELQKVRQELRVAVEELESSRTARREAESATRKLRFLAEAWRILDATLDYDSRLQQLADLVVPELADWAIVDLLEGARLRQVGLAHGDPGKVALIRELRQLLPPDAGAAHVLRRVADSGQPEMLNGLSAEGACAHLLRALGCRSHIVVPLVARQRTLGLLSLIRGQGPYVDEDLQLAVRLAELASLAIDNARLYEEAREALRVRDQFLSVAVHELRVPIGQPPGPERADPAVGDGKGRSRPGGEAADDRAPGGSPGRPGGWRLS